jgi:hypothetical protein
MRITKTQSNTEDVVRTKSLKEIADGPLPKRP